MHFVKNIAKFFNAFETALFYLNLILKTFIYFSVAEKRLLELKKEGYMTAIDKEMFKIIVLSPLMQRLLKK